MTAARPDRTYAVVVGVERYAAGPSWDLPGPAADARRFTAWLRGHGVPASHIFLLLDPLAGAGGPEVDVTAAPAGREAVQEVLTRRLPALDGDLLWVFWGGHGVTDPQGHRRLFYADAAADDRRNLDLDAWLTAFTTDLLPGFRRQVWLVDSCQTFVEDLGFARALPSELPPGGDRLPAREQFVLLASGPGQRAVNDPARQTGAFSRAALAALAATDGGCWPPDMNVVAETVIGQFNEGAQRPTSLWYRSGAGDVRHLAFPAPRRREEPVPDAALTALVNLLAGWPTMADRDHRQLVLDGLPTDQAGAIRRLAAPRPDIISIVRTSCRYPDGLAELVRALADVEPGSLEQSELKDWADRWLPPDPGV
ncbi:caspase family protein [Streptomyces sp. NPDC049687]|uniref:effector-associated domain 2-containing protein n=1 Tax=Streptomyces sp. NPDC049687 TaxID=3365596 RepID=UPI003792EE2E